MMLKRLSGIIILMTAFWAIFLMSSWLLAKLYTPWIRYVTYGLIPEGMVDVFIWVGVVIVVGVILICFRKLLHKLFWHTVEAKKLQS